MTRKIVLTAVLALALFAGRSALALTLDSGLDDAAGPTGAGFTLGGGIEGIIGNIIGVVLGLLGIIFLVLTIYSGFLWMTAAGNEKQVATAKSIIVSSIIGLVITLSAYAISEFVIRQLTTATSLTP